MRRGRIWDKETNGDQVLWMQEHLAAAIPSQATTGIFDATTAANLESFQTSHGLPATGTTTAATWQALLALTPIAVDWAGTGPSSTGPPRRTTVTSTSHERRRQQPSPPSPPAAP